MPSFQFTNTYDHTVYILVGSANTINVQDLEADGIAVAPAEEYSGEVGEQEIIRSSHPIKVDITAE